MMNPPKPKSIYTVEDEKVKINLHHGQWDAWSSLARITLVLAGTQGGKTSFGPLWLWREISQCGPGDYMVVCPTYPLLGAKALPEFRRWFEEIMGAGKYKTSDRLFEVSTDGEKKLFGSEQSEKTRILFGYATDPDSLESATAKAAWLDEAGQKKFKLGSFEAVKRRLSLYMGRILITTTPYSLGWLKQQIYDRWVGGDKSINVIRFESIENPLFSKEAWEDAKRTLPAWKFDMFYRAIFTRPAGLIYDNFDENRDVCQPFALPEWYRYIGLDFGAVNTAAVLFAHDPERDKFFMYKCYKAGGRSSEQHAREILRGQPPINKALGGARSEGQWRREFGKGGLRVGVPVISSVELGIDRVYAAHQEQKIVVFADALMYLDEKLSYGRELDDNNLPTEKIENKSAYHLMDAERYIVSYFMRQPRIATSSSG